MIRLKTNGIIVLVLFILLVSNLCVRAQEDDYWVGDFDTDKNCEKEELVKKLMEDQSPSRCAQKSKGKQMHMPRCTNGPAYGGQNVKNLISSIVLSRSLSNCT